MDMKHSTAVLIVGTPAVLDTKSCMSITPVSAGSASAVDFQQPLALTVELARVAEDHKSVAHPDDAIGDLGASPADIADAVNPANDGSPAQDIANKVIENIQPNSSSAQKLSDALGNPATDDAPKLQDAIEQPAEMLKPGREASDLKTSTPPPPPPTPDTTSPSTYST